MRKKNIMKYKDCTCREVKKCGSCPLQPPKLCFSIKLDEKLGEALNRCYMSEKTEKKVLRNLERLNDGYINKKD